MKRFTAMILCILWMLSLCACEQKQDEIQEPVNFYYCKEEISYQSVNGVIEAEICEGVNHRGDVESMLSAYLQGPYSPAYIAPFPANTELLSIQFLDGEAYLTFNDAFAQLTGMKLSTACSCITLTLAEYTDVETVRFTAATQQLDNKDEIVLKVSDIVLLDTVEMEG